VDAKMAEDVAPRPRGARLASGSMFSLASIVATRAASVVNAIVIIRVLGPNDYGVLSIVTLTMSVMLLVATFQIPAALVKYLSDMPQDRQDEASRLISSGLLLASIATALAMLVIIILAPILAFSVYGDSRLQLLLLVASLSLLLSSISAPLFATFQGFEHIRELGVRTAVSAILSIPSTVVLVVLFGLLGAVIALAVNSCISIAVNVALLRRIWVSHHLRLRFILDRSACGKLLNYSYLAVLSAIVVSVTLWFCNSLLVTSKSFVELGRYSAGYGLAAYLLFISVSIGVPLVPIVSRLHKESPAGMPQFVASTIRVGSLLTLIPTLILAALPEPFLRILYDAPYVAAAPVVRFAAPAMFLASIGALVGYIIAGTGQMRGGLMLNVSWAVTFVGLSLVLVPQSGEVGLAVAVLCAYAVLFVAAMIFAMRSWKVDLAQLSPILLIAFISVPAAMLVSMFSGWGRVALAALLVAAVAYAGLQTMNAREKEVLFQPLRRAASWIHPRQ